MRYIKGGENLEVIFNNMTWDNLINSLVGKTRLRPMWNTQYFTPLRICDYELFKNCNSNRNIKLNVLYKNIIR